MWLPQEAGRGWSSEGPPCLLVLALGRPGQVDSENPQRALRGAGSGGGLGKAQTSEHQKATCFVQTVNLVSLSIFPSSRSSRSVSRFCWSYLLTSLSTLFLLLPIAASPWPAAQCPLESCCCHPSSPPPLDTHPPPGQLAESCRTRPHPQKGNFVSLPTRVQPCDPQSTVEVTCAFGSSLSWTDRFPF